MNTRSPVARVSWLMVMFGITSRSGNLGDIFVRNSCQDWPSYLSLHEQNAKSRLRARRCVISFKVPSTSRLTSSRHCFFNCSMTSPSLFWLGMFCCTHGKITSRAGRTYLGGLLSSDEDACSPSRDTPPVLTTFLFFRSNLASSRSATDHFLTTACRATGEERRCCCGRCLSRNDSKLPGTRQAVRASCRHRKAVRIRTPCNRIRRGSSMAKYEVSLRQCLLYSLAWFILKKKTGKSQT
mmetsp:Transcript_63144/g.175056  ORF Transcript_63144/g.175056 Transcript_63144/m.175056 type:complete len:239 (+) Transcript_63144:707-1423(+)